MKETTIRFSAVTALELAAEQAGIELSDVKNVDLNVDPDGLYHIAFWGSWMSYVCYIDCASGEIRGFFSEPLDEEQILSETEKNACSSNASSSREKQKYRKAIA